ncbi:MAG: zonular occludens toxin domain-containing protein [Motiliproteus sp.]
MTGVIHHGNPGSFKSFCVVQNAVIPALLKGRTVVTNIRGLDSLEQIEEAMDCKLPEEAQLIHVDETEKGFIAMRSFHHWVPIGALIAMDETQKIYSKKRHRDLKQFDLKLTDAAGELRSEEDIKANCPLWDGEFERPDSAETAIDMHRHYNWDIYCTTPNISKVHPEIREAFEVAYRHRALGALLPWWKNKWKEFTHDPEFSGKQLSHYMGSAKTYKADLRIFKCYKSTKTGKALGTAEVRPIYRDGKLQFFGLAIICALSFFVYTAIQKLDYGSVLTKDTNQAADENGLISNQSSADNNRDVAGSNTDTAKLEADFNALASPVEKSGLVLASYKTVEGISDFLGRYVKQGYEIRLGAVVQRADGSLMYQILVSDEDKLIDRVSHKDILKMGYTHSYDESGLLIASDREAFLVRSLGYFELPATQRRKDFSL